LHYTTLHLCLASCSLLGYLLELHSSRLALSFWSSACTDDAGGPGKPALGVRPQSIGVNVGVEKSAVNYISYTCVVVGDSQFA